jgi:hypothetical protein
MSQQEEQVNPTQTIVEEDIDKSQRTFVLKLKGKPKGNVQWAANVEDNENKGLKSSKSTYFHAQ